MFGTSWMMVEYYEQHPELKPKPMPWKVFWLLHGGFFVLCIGGILLAKYLGIGELQ